jgi:hypothetical protein
VVKGAAVFAVAEAGYKAYDTYQNAETRDEKAEGYGAAAGGLAGTLTGAAAGAAIGTAVLPVIGTFVGGLIGGYLGSQGGDALGGAIGKSMFGTPDELKRMPAAGPLMMSNAGKDIPPVMGGIAKSFAAPVAGSLVMARGGAPVMPVRAAETQPGDAARSMMLPPASADIGAGPLAKVLAPAVKPEPAKIESKVDIQAPFSLVVNGDVKDGAALYAQLKPFLDQHQRDLGKQLESRKLYDEPHV